MVKLFSSVLRQDNQGRYWLKTPAEEGLIEVEDVPFIVIDLSIEQSGQKRTVTMVTNLGETCEVNAQNTIQMKGNIPYIQVRDNLEARITRPVLLSLADLVEEDIEDIQTDHKYGFWSGSKFHTLEE